MTYADHVQAASRHAAALLTMPTLTRAQDAAAVRALQDDLAALLAAMTTSPCRQAADPLPDFGMTALVGTKVAERTGNTVQTPVCALRPGLGVLARPEPFQCEEHDVLGRFE